MGKSVATAWMVLLKLSPARFSSNKLWNCSIRDFWPLLQRDSKKNQAPKRSVEASGNHIDLQMLPDKELGIDIRLHQT
jgi:hypothetical protein